MKYTYNTHEIHTAHIQHKYNTCRIHTQCTHNTHNTHNTPIIHTWHTLHTYEIHTQHTHKIHIYNTQYIIQYTQHAQHTHTHHTLFVCMLTLCWSITSPDLDQGNKAAGKLRPRDTSLPDDWEKLPSHLASFFFLKRRGPVTLFRENESRSQRSEVISL